jgi:molecular chaperone DnaK (HSP70)
MCWCDAKGQGRDSGQRSRCVWKPEPAATPRHAANSPPPGNRITPSYVAFTEEERLVGDAAKNQAAANPFKTVYGIKRLIGRKFSEKDVQSDIKHFPYKYGNPKRGPASSVY